MAEGLAVSGRPGASENVRLEPTVVPTRLFRLGQSTLGWHPVLVPVRAASV